MIRHFLQDESGAGTIKMSLLASLLAVLSYQCFITASGWLQGTIGSVTTRMLTVVHRVAGG